jgi:hypothetical protein
VLLEGALDPGNHGYRGSEARSGWGCGKGEFSRPTGVALSEGFNGRSGVVEGMFS